MALLRPISRGFVLLALAVASAACTDGVDPGDPGRVPTAPAASDDGLVSEDAGATEFVPGRFVFQFNSITAQATFRGSVATLNVRNGTGSELGAPSLYVMGIDDRRYDGEAADAGPIADGDGVSLEFRFPDEVAPETIGLAVLSFGEDTVGAMAPVPRSEG